MDWERFWDHSFWDRAKKLAAVAGIAALFVAVAWFVYTVWKDRPVGQSAPSQGGSAVSLWTPTFVIGGCVVLAAILNLAAAYISRRKLHKRLSELNAEKNLLSNALDDTNRSLAEEVAIALNAHNEANRHKDELENANRIAVKTQSERDRLQLRVNELYEESEKYEWLHDIVRDQAETLYRFVSITDCRLGKHELRQRTDPYIEFLVTIWNRSIYDIDISEIAGSISFNGREFTETPAWRDRDRMITWGNISSFTFRQKLSSDAVTEILNSHAYFDFDRLEIAAHSNNESVSVKPRLLGFDKVPPTNDELLQKYPKLEIKVGHALYDWIISIGTRVQFSSANPCYVTLILDVTNRRPLAIEIETFKLVVSVKGKDHTAFADNGSQVHPHRFITDEGCEAVGPQAFPNLNHAIPLVCREDMPISGALQFVFNDLDFGHFLDDLDALDDAQFTLLITDRNSEKHPTQGRLKQRDKVAGLFSDG